MNGRCLSWNDIFALGQHTWWDYVVRGMPSSSLDRIGQSQALQAHVAFGQHTRSDDVVHGMTLWTLDNTQSDDVEHGMVV